MTILFILLSYFIIRKVYQIFIAKTIIMKYFFTLIIALYFTTAYCNTKPRLKAPDPIPQTIIDNFFKKYISSPSDAVDYIFSTNKSFKPNQISEIKGKLTGTALTIGTFYGYEQITTKNTSPSLILFSYLAKHDRQPIRFTFMFYKPQDKWILYKFKFDDGFEAELEESAKISAIK